MLKRHLLVTVRNLHKHRAHTLLNLAGLAVGLTCCLLILLYIRHELSYDRHHEHAGRIYRVALDRIYPTNSVQWASIPPAVAAALRETFPEVTRATRLVHDGGVMRYGEQQYQEDDVLAVDSTFFDVFTVPFLAGDPATALRAPEAVVVTASAARKYFGTEDPLGKVLVFDGSQPLTVTGVVEDPPVTSHFSYAFLRPLREDGFAGVWNTAFFFYTYVVLREDTSPEALEAKLPGLARTHMAGSFDTPGGYDAWLAAGNAYRFFLQPLTRIHLYSDLKWEFRPNGDARHVYLFGAIACFILLIACINFVNLTTARSTTRAREVGVRKLLGSSRGQLVAQFMVEAVALTLLALFLALIAMELLLPSFNGLIGRRLALPPLTDGSLPVILAGFVAVTAALAGGYPALALSAARPIDVLKGKPLASRKGVRLRNGLVVFQFATAVLLMIGTAVVYQQARYMLGKKLGFDQEHVVVVDHVHALGDRADAFRQELLRHPGVRSVALVGGVPGRLDGASTYRPVDDPDGVVLNTAIMAGDAHVVETLGLALAAGRAFREGDFADTSDAVILNEAAVRQLGWGRAADAVGRQLLTTADHRRTVVGVLEDFHFEALRHEIRPLVVLPNRHWHGTALVRIRPDDVAGTLASVEATWKQFLPERPFLADFLDASFAALYDTERLLGRLFLLFALLAAVVACLGLFGLAVFMTEQRTKEIGIRKVLGASTPGLVTLLAADFVRLVLAAVVLAAPLAYVGMNWWLQGYAYRTPMPWWTFVGAGVAALGVALATVSYQALRTASSDPVECLRYE